MGAPQARAIQRSDNQRDIRFALFSANVIQQLPMATAIVAD